MPAMDSSVEPICQSLILAKDFRKDCPMFQALMEPPCLKTVCFAEYFEEDEIKGFPDDVVTGIADSLDCNPVFRGHVVSIAEMLAFMVGTIVVLGDHLFDHNGTS